MTFEPRLTFLNLTDSPIGGSLTSVVGHPATTDSGTPEIVVGLVGVAGALLGAVVGGALSYWGSIALQKRAQRGRAAIRRKAKLYTPLRAQLIELLGHLEDPDRYNLEIQTEGEVPQTVKPRPYFTLWSEMVEDGRSVSVSNSIRDSIERSVFAINAFNSTLSELQSTVEEIGLEAYRRVMAEDLRLMYWASSGGANAVMQEREDLDLFWDDRHQNLENEARIRSLIYEDARIVAARRKMLSSDAQLKSALRGSVDDLESAMERIARRYEHEPAED